MIDGVRVLDCTTGIAGGYCTKLLADAGADVVKVELPDGDDLRRWRSGGLFEYLNASKRSVTGGQQQLLTGADVAVTNSPADAARWHEQDPFLVAVSISPFGADGPWAGRPATEFTLQAACGSTGSRGLPEQPPLAVGGRLGEWVTGTYAAVAALAALGVERSRNLGRWVDVAMLDCMAVSLVTYPSVFASFLGNRSPMAGTGRTVEVPSVEPTSDGFVVVTTNSAQQFQDFLVLIGRPDWLDDEKLARAQHRFSRRQEFLESVHHWSLKRTSAEALEEAGGFRIPAGPVLNGSTVAGFEQFEVRGVFEPAPSGRFRQPRRPYRIEGVDRPAPRPAPEIGADDGRVDWPPRHPGQPGRPELPLSGIRILDCTAWWAGPSATQVLAALGADVLKIESVKRPDLMRLSSARPPTEDGWWEWGALFHAANTGKRDVTLDLTRPEGIEIFERLAATADALIENYTPRVMEQFGLGWDRLHRVNPNLIMVRMPAFGLDGPWRDRTGFAQTMECISGLAWRTGYPDGPPVLPRGPCDPLAGMHATLATLLALRSRAGDGHGRLVEVTMVEAALAVAAEQIIEWDATGTLLGREGMRGPGDPQGVYRCAGDDEWVALAVESEGQRRALCGVVGSADEDAISAWCRDLDKDEAAEVLAEAGVPAAAVVSGPDMSRNPQLRHRKLFETEDHPVTGRHEIPVLPFRFSDVDHWMARPSPTLGQHNEEVLTEVASKEELGSLRQAGIIGDRLPDP